MRIIVDSNGLAYRALYSMGGLSHQNSSTGVIFGFLSELRNLAEKFNTNQFVFCWDSLQNYRKLVDPEYKNRAQDMSPEDRHAIRQAHEQFNTLREEILPTMGFRNIFMQTGYESDDIMAWLTYRLPDHYIVATGDDDMLQILNAGDNMQSVKIYNLSKKKIITEEDFTKMYGIKPIQWSAVKAIGGCVSDNVKGIPGVGPESAIKYLNDVLKDGAIKNKITSEVGKIIAANCLELVHLPFMGDREISVVEDRDLYYKEECFYSLNFIDVFKKYGCNSFITQEGLERWRKIFKLSAGR